MIKGLHLSSYDTMFFWVVNHVKSGIWGHLWLVVIISSLQQLQVTLLRKTLHPLGLAVSLFSSLWAQTAQSMFENVKRFECFLLRYQTEVSAVNSIKKLSFKPTLLSHLAHLPMFLIL